MARPVPGLNLNVRDGAAHPANPADIRRVGYCRFVYDVNNSKPDNLPNGQSFVNDVDQLYQQRYLPQQLDPAFAFYDGYLQKCFDADVKPIVVFNHETFGEGWGLDFGGAMQVENPGTATTWSLLSAKLADIMRRVAEKYGARIIYQIWNEQDQPGDSAVGVPATYYAEMLRVCIRAVRSVAIDATVITGGHTSGRMDAYWADVRRADPDVDSLLSGFAVHPYDCGLNTFVEKGGAHVRTLLDVKIGALRGLSTAAARSVWITEFGCGGNAQMNDATAADYASMFFGHIRSKYTRAQVPAAVWFGWGDMNPAAGCIPVAHSAANGRQLWDAFGNPTRSGVPAGNGGVAGSAIAPPPIAAPPPPAAGSSLSAPGLPNAFNNQFELDTDSAKWRKAWGWVRRDREGRRWLKLLAAPDAPYSDVAMRAAAASTAAIEAAIAYLSPETTARYAPDRDTDGTIRNTFCNIFVNDVTRVLHCEIPNNPGNTNVSSMLAWLNSDGAAHGWTRTANGAAAQNHVNAGKVAIVIWSKVAFGDHVALVRPGDTLAHGGADWPRIAQAGALVSSDVSSFSTFGSLWARDAAALAFYLHD